MSLGNSNLGFSGGGGTGGGGGSPITIQNTSSLFSTGLTGTGLDSSATFSNFLGQQAGNAATNASQSNFLGRQAGKSATNAYGSNFLGEKAGELATNANNSNFFGYRAGQGVTNTLNILFKSNFIGYETGDGAVNANNSNFLGNAAGKFATDAFHSNFFGAGAGQEATNADRSNFLGRQAGYVATYAYKSNFLGRQSGFGATNANNSNFFGEQSGFYATGVTTFSEGDTITADNGATSEYVNGTTVKWLDGDWTSVTELTANDGLIAADSDGTCTGYIAVTITYPTTFPLTVGEELISDNGATGTYISDTEVFPLTGDWAASTTVTGQTSGIVADISTNAYITVTFTNIRYTNFNSNFIGKNAGYIATEATNSNFIGASAGYQATNANNSNFLGNNAGYQATNAGVSNFFGYQAGYQATDAQRSNFIGDSAGFEATNASYSNFLGASAGYQATDASYSNFFGNNAGYQVTGEEGEEFNSNFFGKNAGYQATNASYSNFLGNSAGYIATNASYSNFLGNAAGDGATNASYSNFLGYQAGGYAAFATNSNFLGNSAGYQATGVTTFSEGDTITADNGATSEYVNGTTVKWLDGDWTSVTELTANDGLIAADSDGTCTGYIAVTITYPTTFPLTVGEELISDNGATGTYISDTEVFPLTGDWAASTTVTGQTSGIVADISTDAYITIVFTDIRYAEFSSNFFGKFAGRDATAATKSNFFGNSAGYQATNAQNSNFFGYFAGYQATNADNSNFFGASAGQNATNANNSNFLGNSAGYIATNASYSNFLGNAAGDGATNANDSNFLGYQAGSGATNADNSNFFGASAGQNATNANNSNFLGENAGNGATNAVNSIFIGKETGINDTVDNTTNGLSSILIGSFIGTGGYSNSVLLGSGLDGSPIANTKANQFMLADTITDVRWSGIEYTLPSSQAAVAGDVLTNDGAGVLSWASALRGLFAQTDDSTPVTATTVETSLIGTGVGTLTIPANGFQVGDSFSAVLIGHLSCVGTATLHIRVKTATGILLADTGVMAMNTTTDKHWKLDINFTIKLLGAATVAAISSGGLFAYTKNSGLNFEGVNFSITNNTTFDTTISNTLVVTAEWNTNNAGNSIYTEIFTLNKSY